MNTKKKELISVIVPVYNVEKYIRQCIESIKNQTYDNIEIILVDDGSPDMSGKICDEFAADDDRIKVIHKENGGIAFARNSGLDAANGNYVIFVDSDDIIEDHMIEVLFEAADKNTDVIVGGYKRIGSDNKITDIINYDENHYVKDDVKNILLPRFIGSPSTKTNSYISVVWGKLFSMKIIKENSLRFFSERDILSEDLIFLLDYMSHANDVKIISMSGYMYRLNEQSFTKSYTKKLFDRCKYFYYYTCKRIRNYNMSDEAIERLHKRMFVYVRSSIINEIQCPDKKNKNCIRNIKNICSDELIEEIIRNYPIKNLKFNQKIFVLMIKHKFSFILYLCAKFKIM